MIKKKAYIKIGGVSWGSFHYTTIENLKEQIKQSIEVLHPLNSSEEGAEAYRERFRHQDLFIRHDGEKDYQPLN
jgi:hypothetical protein